jgi:hypothetical protein
MARTATITSAPFRLVPVSKWGCRARHSGAEFLLLFLCISACSSFLQERILSASTTSTSLRMSTPVNFPKQGSRTWRQKPRDQGQSGGGDNSKNKAALLVTPPPEKPTAKRVRIKTKPMPVTGYNAELIEDYYDRRPFQVGWRLNSLGFPLLGTLRTTMNANRQ